MLSLHHPEIMQVTCDECLQWVYDFDRKRWNLYGGKRVPRTPQAAPPCWKCPKCTGAPLANPQHGRKTELTARNRRAVEAYYERYEGDRLTNRVFGIIRRQINEHEHRSTAILLELLAHRP